ncbi:MAG: MGMT family protein [bacterium]|jgi:methylated-DNA-protein-cysteine methyltransferase related protein|nr:MGMT family protein [bacterium]
MKPKFPAIYKIIYREVAKIPEGTVATYGQIAAHVGCGPRQVGKALSELPPETHCPWHRVINSRGKVSIRSGNHAAHYTQEDKLEAEGIELKNGKIDLKTYRWDVWP